MVDESEQKAEDIKVDKHRISGFWDTPLDSILRNLGVRAALFSGVNTDQCVLHSLTAANFCTEARVWNVKECFGFVTASAKILKALKEK